MRDFLCESGILVARLIERDCLWSKPGLAFWSKDSEFIQVGTWTHSEGTNLPAHIHNEFAREANRTQEAVYVVSGSLTAALFNDGGSLLEEVLLSAGDLLICFSGGHGYSIVEPNTKVLEIKNGPYLGPDIDRRRI